MDNVLFFSFIASGFFKINFKDITNIKINLSIQDIFLFTIFINFDFMIK